MSSPKGSSDFVFSENGIFFVLADVLREEHERLVTKFGGLQGIRDENALYSAIARPRNLALYTACSSVPLLASALPWAVLRNHPFIDGNKRTAFAALVLFVERNGYRLNCSQVEETTMVLRAATSEITEDYWNAWVRTVVLPR